MEFCQSEKVGTLLKGGICLQPYRDVIKFIKLVAHRGHWLTNLGVSNLGGPKQKIINKPND